MRPLQCLDAIDEKRAERVKDGAAHDPQLALDIGCTWLESHRRSRYELPRIPRARYDAFHRRRAGATELAGAASRELVEPLNNNCRISGSSGSR
jgi:hypothetical protein